MFYFLTWLTQAKASGISGLVEPAANGTFVVLQTKKASISVAVSSWPPVVISQTQVPSLFGYVSGLSQYGLIHQPSPTFM